MMVSWIPAFARMMVSWIPAFAGMIVSWIPAFARMMVSWIPAFARMMVRLKHYQFGRTYHLIPVSYPDEIHTFLIV
jgi:hypothetical protein